MDRRNSLEFALARSDGLLVEQIDAETVVYDSESKEAHCLSPLAAAVFAEADGRTDDAALAATASSRLGEPVDEAEVGIALAHLDERGLLVAPPNGISRRQMMVRTAAVTATVSAAPMITSIVTPAHAASPGRSCQNAKCSSQSEGDAYCACVNTCPPSTNFPNSSSCTPFDGSPAPFYGSCECLRCPRADSASDNGEFQDSAEPPKTGLQLGFEKCEALYGANYWKTNPNGADDAANWKDWTQDCNQGHVNNNQEFGCKDTGKAIDGACYQEEGDSSQAGVGLCE